MAGFPQELNAALEALISGRDNAQLGRDAQTISENYRLRTGTGGRLLTKESEAAAYAAARMPATYAAAQAALEEALAASGMEIHSLVDCGAGTGAATWAAAGLLDLERIICLEREEAMRAVGSSAADARGSQESPVVPILSSPCLGPSCRTDGD